MVNNPYFYSTMGTAPSTQIADSSDNPHSGLIKALSVGMAGNYALKSGNNFAITVASASTVTVNSGVVFKNGAFQAVNATSSPLTLGTTAANSTYSLIVVDSSNALVIRTTTTGNAVPAYTLGDIPIALLLYTGASATMEIQFLTTNKASNSLSIGYDNSGYSETANIVGASGVTTITAASSTDVKVKLAGTAAGDTFEVIDSAAQIQLKVQGDGVVNVPALTASRALVTDASNNLSAATTTSTEIGYVNGVTSAIQTQLGTKLQTGLHTIWVPASAMYPNTTNGCSALTQVELSNGPELKVLDFAAGADDFAQFTVAFPKSWNEGVIKFQVFYTVSGTNTGTTAWGLRGASMADNYDINHSDGFGAIANTPAKAHSGTSGDINVTAQSADLTIRNAAVDTVTFFEIHKDTSASGQTGASRLIGIKLLYTLDGVNDA